MKQIYDTDFLFDVYCNKSKSTAASPGTQTPSPKELLPTWPLPTGSSTEQNCQQPIKSRRADKLVHFGAGVASRRGTDLPRLTFCHQSATIWASQFHLKLYAARGFLTSCAIDEKPSQSILNHLLTISQLIQGPMSTRFVKISFAFGRRSSQST